MAAYTLEKVDDKLWRKVKVLVAMRGTTIRNLLIELLEKEVKKGKWASYRFSTSMSSSEFSF